MTGFLYACCRPMLSAPKFPAAVLARGFGAMLRRCLPGLLVVVLLASTQSCEAGWFSWLWGSDTQQLERSLDVAQEAARVTSQAAEAQARQAAAQAEQNARLADTLGKLSTERLSLAGHLQALTELGLRDSQWAAAINASGQVLVSCAVLLMGGLALWLTNTPSESEHAELAQAVDFLVEEVAANATHAARANRGPLSGSLRMGHSGVHTLTGQAWRGPGGDNTGWESEASNDPDTDGHVGDSPDEPDGGPIPF